MNQVNAFDNRTYAISSEKYSLPRKSLLNYLVLYLIAAMIVLIPACISPTGEFASFGFITGSILIVIMTKDLNNLTFFYIIILINSSLAEVTIIGMTVTITVIMYIYFIALMLVNLRYIGVLKRILVPALFMFLWIAYRVFNALLFGTDVVVAVWQCVPLMIAIVTQVMVLRREKYRVLLIISIVVATIIICGTGYVELFIGKTFFYSLWKGVAYRFGIMRVGSTLADPNFLCLVDVTLLFIINSELYKKIFGWRFINVLSLLIVIQVVLTFSRAGIVALIVCYIIKVMCKKKNWALAFIPVLLLGAMVVPSLVDILLNIDVNSTDTRMRVVAIALVLWRKKPLIGNGSGFFYDASQGFIGTHITTMNVYVEQLVEYGIIGMMFYIIYIVYILKVPVMSILVKRNINFKASPEIIAAISAWLLISYSLDTFSKILIWVMPAIVLSLLKFEQEDKDNIIEPELYINPSRL